jgi:hypothetical protein
MLSLFMGKIVWLTMDKQINPIRQVRKSPFRWIGYFFLWALLCVMLGVLLRTEDGDRRVSRSNRDVSWERASAGFAPHPDQYSEPVIQVYAARTWGAKQAFAVHTWIATKRANDSDYKVSQVIGWRQRRGGTALFSENSILQEKY